MACGDGLEGTVDDVGDDVLSFLEQDNPKSCAGCDLANADLTGAILTAADLTGVNLTDAFSFGANGERFVGADFGGAFNVPDKYLKD